MENLPTSATGAINLGAAAYRDSRLDEARAFFARALVIDPNSERAWLWFATVADDPAEQRYCLNRALEINPESTGLRRLALMPAGPSRTPEELVELDQPPLPPDLATAPGVPLPLMPRAANLRRHRARAPKAGAVAVEPAAPPEGMFRRAWIPWLLLAVLLAIVALAVVLYLRQQQGPSESAYAIAYVGPLSGEDASIGEEQLHALQLAVDERNASGGIAGHPVEVLSYDDQNDPAQAAKRAAEIVANDKVLLVIGHDLSDASLAAAPVYEKAGLAAISPSSTADELTANHPWYFRSVFTNQEQGQLIAAYSRQALGHDRASIVTTAGAYQSSLARSFADEFGREGTIVKQWTLDPTKGDASIASIVEELKATDDPGIVFLPLLPEEARPLLLALGRAGVHLPMVGGEALGYEEFAESFASEPEEVAQPGFFTNGLDVAAPLIYDSLGGDALAFARRFRATYGTSPEWFGAKAYDAGTLALHALAVMSGAEVPPADLAAQRKAVRDALAATNSVDTAVAGLSGPLYFDATRSTPQTLSFGEFELDRLLSAPVQYRAVQDPEKFDLAADLANGRAFKIGDQIFRQYRVVYVGVDLNEITNLDPQAETFDADFFLWFRYSGDASAENVFFSNAADPTEALPDPLDSTEDDAGRRFAMYRINSTFTEPLNFQDYPWDQHVLNISMQNVRLSQDDLVYVPDQANLRQPQSSRLRSGVDYTRPFNRIPSWIAESVFYAQGTATSRSTTPDPRTGAPEYDQVSTYQVQMSYARDVRAFLVKNLLPLVLLALVTYISLFFSPENASTRIGFSITAILTTAVLLQSIASNLPDIGYTVAIEWGFYAYIALSAVLVLVNITIERWYKAKRYAAVSQLDWIARIVYPIVLALVVAAYAVRFA